MSRLDLWHNGTERFEYSLFPPVSWEGEVDDQQLHYTVYILTFLRKDIETGSNLQWKVSRRFREFSKLHQQLLSRSKSTAYLQYCPALNRPLLVLPPQPRKGLVALSSHQELEERRKALQTYVHSHFFSKETEPAVIREFCARKLEINVKLSTSISRYERDAHNYWQLHEAIWALNLCWSSGPTLHSFPR